MTERIQSPERLIESEIKRYLVRLRKYGLEQFQSYTEEDLVELSYAIEGAAEMAREPDRIQALKDLIWFVEKLEKIFNSEIHDNE